MQRRVRTYSASLDLGHYPVAESPKNSIWSIICCCFHGCFAKARIDNGYDSDSSEQMPKLESDTDDE